MFSNNNIFIFFFFRTNDKKYFDKDKKFKEIFILLTSDHLCWNVSDEFIYFSSRLFLFIFYFLFWLNKIDPRSAVRQILLLWERTMRGRAKDEWKKRWFQLNSERNRRADRERDVHYSKDSRRLTLLRPLLPRYNLNCRLPLQRREKGGCNRQILFHTITLPPAFLFFHTFDKPSSPRVHLTTSDYSNDIPLIPLTRKRKYVYINHERYRFSSLKISNFFFFLNRR